MEADCVPLCLKWKERLVEEFRNSKKMVLGPWLEKGDAGCRHINGNCIMSLDFGSRCPMIFSPPHRVAWDAALAMHIMPHAQPAALIFSDYRLGTPDNEWKGCDYLWQPKTYGMRTNPRFQQQLQVVCLHGIKGMQGIECVWAKLLPNGPL